MSISAVGGMAGYQASSFYTVRNTSRDDDPAARFAEMDTNGDGGLDIEESGLSQARFDLLDVDGDGLLTESDRQSYQNSQTQETGQGGFSLDLSAILAELDVDGDDQLSLEESGLEEEQFDALDTNQDGYVSLAELEAARPDRPEGPGGPGGPPPGGGPGMNPEDLLAELDEDGDEQISLEESGLSESQFDALDTNQDGYVSLEELLAWREARGQTRSEEGQEVAGNGYSAAYALRAYVAQMSRVAEEQGSADYTA